MGRRGRDRGQTIYANVEVTTDADVDIEIEDLSDEELGHCVEEARKRGLGSALGSRRDRLVPIYEDLVVGRTAKALENFERALFAEEDGYLLDCWNSLREGKWSAAICALDSAVYPPPPKRKEDLTLFKKSTDATMTAPTDAKPATGP